MRATVICLLACVAFAGPAGAEPLTTNALPNVHLISGPAPVTSSRSATFRFESDVSSIGFVCSLDGAAAAPCASPAPYADLADGYVSGTIIECPMHNGRFDFTTGEAKGAPACVDLKTYPVKVEGGRLFLKVG